MVGTENTNGNRKHHGNWKPKSGKIKPREEKTPFRELKTRSPYFEWEWFKFTCREAHLNHPQRFRWELLVLGGVLERMKKHFGSVAFWGVKKNFIGDENYSSHQNSDKIQVPGTLTIQDNSWFMQQDSRKQWKIIMNPI